MICESWTNALCDVDVNGYARVGKHRKQKITAKRDSGGLEIYIKENISHGVSHEAWDFEDGLILKFDADIFGWQKDMFLFFTYLKPYNSSRYDILTDNDCFEKLINQIASINTKGGDILICGDLNSRVAELNDYLSEINDENISSFDLLPPNVYDHSFHPEDFIRNNMSVKRSNHDKKTNDYGIKLLQLCKSCDLAILNGRAGSDKGKGITTFCGPKGESTVDLVLCNKYVLNNVIDFSISDHVCFSDHKIVCFKLKSFLNNNIHKGNNKSHDNKSHRPKWKEDRKESYLLNINDPDTLLKFDQLVKTLNDNPCKSTLNFAVEELSSLVTNAGVDHRVVNKSSLSNSNKGHIWYDQDCKIERKKFLERKLEFLNNKTDCNRIAMCKQRSIYRHTCRKKRRLYNRNEAAQLVTLSKTNTTQFWKKIERNVKNRMSLI